MIDPFQVIGRIDEGLVNCCITVLLNDEIIMVHLNHLLKNLNDLFQSAVSFEGMLFGCIKNVKFEGV